MDVNSAKAPSELDEMEANFSINSNDPKNMQELSCMVRIFLPLFDQLFFLVSG